MEILILVLLIFGIFINMLNSMLLISERIEKREIGATGQNNNSAVMLNNGKKQLENLMNYTGGDENDSI